jgi:hypothetical protein
VNNKFAVQYFLNLVLSDFEDRRYFKQIEVNLIRLDQPKNDKIEDNKINENQLQLQ